MAVDTERRKVRIFFGVLALAMVLIGWFSYSQRNDVSVAREEVTRCGGKAAALGDEPFRLGTVDLSGRPITDADIAVLAPLFAAVRGPLTLDLSKTQITDTGVAQLSVLDHVDTLRLEGVSIHGSGLAQLSRLGTESGETPADVALSLAGSTVDDDSLPFLTAISRLAELDLSRTKINGSGLVHLHGLRYLHKLILAGSEVDDAGLAGLDGWAKLSELDLGKTQVGDAGVTRLRKLEGLTAISLPGTRITERALRCWLRGPGLPVFRSPIRLLVTRRF